VLISGCGASGKNGTGSANGNYAEHKAGRCSSTKIRSGRQFIQGQPNNLLDPQTSAQARRFGQTQGKNPKDSTDFDSRHLPTTEEMDDMRRDDDWQKTEAEPFSIKKIRQYFARCAPLSA